jgi:hypothetical protein
LPPIERAELDLGQEGDVGASQGAAVGASFAQRRNP